MSDPRTISISEAVKENLLPIKEYVGNLGLVDIFPEYSAEFIVTSINDVTDVYNDFPVYLIKYVVRFHRGQKFIGAGEYSFELDVEFTKGSMTVENYFNSMLNYVFLVNTRPVHLFFGINQHTIPYMTMDQAKDYMDFLGASKQEPMFLRLDPDSMHKYFGIDVGFKEANVWAPKDVLQEICTGLKYYAPNKQITEAAYYLIRSISTLNEESVTRMMGGFVVEGHPNQVFAFEEHPNGGYEIVDAPHRLLDEYELLKKLKNS